MNMYSNERIQQVLEQVVADIEKAGEGLGQLAAIRTEFEDLARQFNVMKEESAAATATRTLLLGEVEGFRTERIEMRQEVLRDVESRLARVYQDMLEGTNKLERRLEAISREAADAIDAVSGRVTETEVRLKEYIEESQRAVERKLLVGAVLLAAAVGSVAYFG